MTNHNNSQTKTSTKSGVTIFLIIWFGQFVSLLGTRLTGFALGVWVYQETGSVTQFAIILLTTTLPFVLTSPVAGALVDRWDRRWVMIISDAGAGLSTLIVAYLFFSGSLENWHIYLSTAVGSFLGAFQYPAYAATIPLLVPKEHLGRANGLEQFAEAFTQLIGPLLGGVLLVSIGLDGIILIDAITFIFALSTLFFIRLPQPPQSQEEKEEESIWHETYEGWQYLVQRPGFLALACFFGISNFAAGLVEVLVTPLVLSVSTANTLGLILSTGGIGMLVGSVVMSIWGGPKTLIRGVLIFEFIGGMVIFLAGWKVSIPLYMIAAFTYFFCLPIINGCSELIYQRKVPLDKQGRVFAITSALEGGATPLAFVIAGPLADSVFEPLLATDGAWVNSVGNLVGVGTGRGVGFMFVLIGLINIAAVWAAYMYPRLRHLETEIPDAIEDKKTKTETSTISDTLSAPKPTGD